MSLKKFPYKSTPRTRAAAKSVIAYLEGRIKEPKGFVKRVVLDPAYIKQVRQKLDLTQREFATLLTVDGSTVEKWEQGRRHPDGPAVSMIMLLPRHPELRKWLEALKKTPVAA